jgi:hypothetical protein
MAQVVECWPSKHKLEVMGSISNTGKEKKKGEWVFLDLREG